MPRLGETVIIRETLILEGEMGTHNVGYEMKWHRRSQGGESEVWPAKISAHTLHMMDEATWNFGSDTVFRPIASDSILQPEYNHSVQFRVPINMGRPGL